MCAGKSFTSQLGADMHLRDIGYDRWVGWDKDREEAMSDAKGFELPVRLSSRVPQVRCDTTRAAPGEDSVKPANTTG